MGKRLLILFFSLFFVAGVGMGGVGHWFFKDKLPRDRAMAAAKTQQEQMNKMVRSGSLINVSKDEILVKVENSGDPDLVGKEIAFKMDPSTTIQHGSEMLSPNQKGEKVDIEKYIAPGKQVDVLARDLDGQDRNKVQGAVAIHWMAPIQTSGQNVKPVPVPQNQQKK